jgi:hypothetical protein
MTDEIGNQRATAEQVVIGKPLRVREHSGVNGGVRRRTCEHNNNKLSSTQLETTRGNSAHEQSETWDWELSCWLRRSLRLNGARCC